MSVVGDALVGAGSIVAVATVVAVATGYNIDLTPAMVHLLVYKGLAAAAMGLIVAGSWIGRHNRQEMRNVVPAPTSVGQLPERAADFSRNDPQDGLPGNVRESTSSSSDS